LPILRIVFTSTPNSTEEDQAENRHRQTGSGYNQSPPFPKKAGDNVPPPRHLTTSLPLSPLRCRQGLQKQLDLLAFAQRETEELLGRIVTRTDYPTTGLTVKTTDAFMDELIGSVLINLRR
jgi:hypothetical protein